MTQYFPEFVSTLFVFERHRPRCLKQICNFQFTLLRKKPRYLRPWMNAWRVPYEAHMSVVGYASEGSALRSMWRTHWLQPGGLHNILSGILFLSDNFSSFFFCTTRHSSPATFNSSSRIHPPHGSFQPRLGDVEFAQGTIVIDPGLGEQRHCVENIGGRGHLIFIPFLV